MLKKYFNKFKIKKIQELPFFRTQNKIIIITTKKIKVAKKSWQTLL